MDDLKTLILEIAVKEGEKPVLVMDGDMKDKQIRIWLEETGRNYPIRIHSQNFVGVENMRRIIQRNGWKEIK